MNCRNGAQPVPQVMAATGWNALEKYPFNDNSSLDYMYIMITCNVRHLLLTC